MNWREFEAKQRILEFGDRTVSYVDEGAGDPVVFLHGFPAWGFYWDGVHDGRAIVPDLLGYGTSDKSDRFDRAIDKQAPMLEALLDELEIARAAFVGHDVGAAVALRFACRRPARVERLVLLNPAYRDGEFGESKLSLKSLRSILRLRLRRGFALEPSDDFLDGLAAPYRTEVGMRSLVRCAESLNANHAQELSTLLPSLRTPTTILAADGEEWAASLASDLPHAKRIELAGARHLDGREEAARAALP